MGKIKIGENEYRLPVTIDSCEETYTCISDENCKEVSKNDMVLAINELAQLRAERDALKARVEELGEQVEIGVIEFHTKKNAELRDEFYEVVDDLRNAGSIVDVWLFDIGAVLRKHGYTMRVYRNTTPGGDDGK